MTRRERMTYLACAYATVAVFLAVCAMALAAHQLVSGTGFALLSQVPVLLIPADAIPPFDGIWRADPAGRKL